jgi:hypothetical protein
MGNPLKEPLGFHHYGIRFFQTRVLASAWILGQTPTCSRRCKRLETTTFPSNYPLIVGYTPSSYDPFLHKGSLSLFIRQVYIKKIVQAVQQMSREVICSSSTTDQSEPPKIPPRSSRPYEVSLPKLFKMSLPLAAFGLLVSDPHKTNIYLFLALHKTSKSCALSILQSWGCLDGLECQQRCPAKNKSRTQKFQIYL